MKALKGFRDFTKPNVDQLNAATEELLKDVKNYHSNIADLPLNEKAEIETVVKNLKAELEKLDEILNRGE